MNKQEWLEYFEAINGRTATAEEIAQAQAAGEFQAEPVAPQPQPVSQNPVPPVQEPVQPQPASQNPVPPIQEQAQQATVPPTQPLQQTVPPVANPSNPQSDEFKRKLNHFWKWLVEAWKKPTSEGDIHSPNGYIAFGCLTVLYTLTIFLSAYHVGRMATGGINSFVGSLTGSSSSYVTNPVDVTALFMILVASGLFIFSMILGGFVVKRMVFQDTTFTFKKAFDYYGRLFSINILLTAVSTVFALLNVLPFALFLVLVSVFIFSIASTFAIAQTKGESRMDPFYKFLLAVIVNGVIALIFFYAEMSLVASYLQNLLSNIF